MSKIHNILNLQKAGYGKGYVMKKRSILSALLIASILVGCGKAETEETTTTTASETTTAETTVEETTEETTEATPTPVPTPVEEEPAGPFEDQAVYDFATVNEFSEEQLQEFYDLFYTDWFYGCNDSEMELIAQGDETQYFEIAGNGINFRPAWLFTSYSDPRDCNPYIACNWLQHDGHNIPGSEEDVGVAFVTEADIIDAQIREFTGYGNSELAFPMGNSTYNGVSYVIWGPATNGGWGQDNVLAGMQTEDGRVIVLVGYRTDNVGTTAAIAVLEPNEDGTYRFVNNHRISRSFIVGSTEEEITAEDLRNSITEELDNTAYGDFYLTEDDYQYDTEESLRFSVYLSRNAYLASYGVIFDDPLLQFWFGAYDWYEPTIPESEFDYSVMSDIEQANVAEADALLSELN